MFKKKLTLQECQKEFDLKAHYLGVLTFQMKELDTLRNKTINDMEALEKQGKEFKKNIKQEIEDTAEAEKKKEENAIN